jgi:hypothetical protein
MPGHGPARHSPALRLPRPNGSLACPACPESRREPRREGAKPAEGVTGICFSNRNSKLLEMAVTQTKQTPEVRSNRYKIAGASDAIWRCGKHKKLVTGFLTGTPKQLEIAVSHTKQITATLSNRDTKRGSSSAIWAVESHVARVSCPDEGSIRPEAFEFSAGLKCARAENRNGPNSLTSEEVSYIAADGGTESNVARVFRPEAFDFSAALKDVDAEMTNGPTGLTGGDSGKCRAGRKTSRFSAPIVRGANGANDAERGHAIVSVLSEVK